MKTGNIKITPSWNKAKEQIWTDTFAELEDEDQTKIISIHKNKNIAYVAAAVILMLLALPSVAYFYTQEIVATAGQHVSAVLPDGSKVQLNAESSINYKPYWWTISRSLNIKGEAFFEVAKGKIFKVNTSKGTVSVLGTSFNIFDRHEGYHVTCLKGKVLVAHNNQTITLTQGMYADIDEKDHLTSSHTIQEIGWMNHRFSFQNTPLEKVIKEVERQYNIKIKETDKIDYLYTGNFSKDHTAQQVLEIIGKPFGIRFEVEK